MRPDCSRCACPTAHGGLGASFADYVRVSEEIGRYCGATALTFNMHNATMLWCGEVADLLDLTRGAALAMSGSAPRCSAASSSTVTSTANRSAKACGRSHVRRRHPSRPVDGGWLVTGRKIFASLSGAANFYNVTCQAAGESFIRLLGVPADADGVTIEDEWDPLGMRGTVSRTLVMDDAFVPDGERMVAARHLQPGRAAIPLAVPVVVSRATSV